MATTKQKIFFVTIVFISFFLFQIDATCNAVETQNAAVRKNGTVAVMPFFTGEYSDQIEPGRPPLQFLLDQIAVEEGDENSTGEKIFTNLMCEALQERSTFKLISHDVVQDGFAHMSIDHQHQMLLYHNEIMSKL